MSDPGTSFNARPHFGRIERASLRQESAFRTVGGTPPVRIAFSSE
jgi:hypothetical protein